VTAVLGSVLLACVTLMAFIGLRSLVTYEICMRANDMLRAHLEFEVDAERADIRLIDRLYNRLEADSSAIFLNPFVWTARQAFPWLVELTARRAA
jgi:hypothetical protein